MVGIEELQDKKVHLGKVHSASNSADAIERLALVLVGGLMAGAILIQAALVGRLVVQLAALEGRVADTLFSVGGFFQRPFEGYSAGAIRLRGIFEPETILAITVYAGAAIALAIVVALLHLSSRRPVRPPAFSFATIFSSSSLPAMRSVFPARRWAPGVSAQAVRNAASALLNPERPAAYWRSVSNVAALTAKRTGTCAASLDRSIEPAVQKTVRGAVSLGRSIAPALQSATRSAVALGRGIDAKLERLVKAVAAFAGTIIPARRRTEIAGLLPEMGMPQADGAGRSIRLVREEQKLEGANGDDLTLNWRKAVFIPLPPAEASDVWHSNCGQSDDWGEQSHWTGRFGPAEVRGFADFIPAQGGCIGYFAVTGATLSARLCLSSPFLERHLWRLLHLNFPESQGKSSAA